MTPADVGRYLGRTPAALAQLRYLGTGPAFIKTGALVRYRKSDLEAWLDTYRRTRT